MQSSSVAKQSPRFGVKREHHRSVFSPAGRQAFGEQLLVVQQLERAADIPV
jgi:hypothetical protein